LETREFLYQIKPVRANFMENQSAEEKNALEAHFFYLQNLLQEGKLVLAGPCLDALFGIVILQDIDREEANDIMVNDPAIVHEIMTGELFPFRISLLKK
jgi:uncharacterized protein